MPTPHKGESESDFVARYMASPEAQRDFPDEKQRLAVAYSESKRRNKKKKSAGRVYHKRMHSPFSYKLGLSGLSALDGPETEVWCDPAKMTAKGILSTVSRDRDGDIMEVAGIDTSRHRIYPVVLLDHGQAYPCPIGLCQSPDGEYMVSCDPDLGEVTQTTYFAQGNEVAEQVFHLINTKVLRGNSIGYKLIKWKLLRPDPSLGMTKSNKLIQACEMVEATWTGVPMNSECVMPVLSKNRIEGKQLAPCIKSLLTAWAPPKKAWANGAIFAKAQSSVDETTGGSLRGARKMDDEMEDKHMDQLEAPMPTDVKAAVPGDDEEDDIMDDDMMGEESSNAKAMRDLHADLSKFHGLYSKAMGVVDHPECKAHMNNVLTSLLQHKDATHDLWDKHYAENAPLSDSPDEPDHEGEENEEGEGQDIEDKTMGHGEDEEEHTPVEIGEKVPEKGKPMKKSMGMFKKAMSRQDMDTMKSCYDLLHDLEGEDHHHNTVKLAIKHVKSCVQELMGRHGKKKLGQDVDEDATPVGNLPKKKKATVDRHQMDRRNPDALMGAKSVSKKVSKEVSKEDQEALDRIAALGRSIERKSDILERTLQSA